MTYLRWIRKKNGKLSGPYLYKSVRQGNKVIGHFVRKVRPSEFKKFGVKKDEK